MLIKTNDTALYMHAHLLVKLHLNLRSICKCLKMRSMDCTITFFTIWPWAWSAMVEALRNHTALHTISKSVYQLWNRKCLCHFFQDGSISRVGWASRLTVVCFNGFFAFHGDVMKMTSWDF